MLVMPSNSTGERMRALDRDYPGQLGHLIGSEDGAWRTPFLPYALDNGAYRAWKYQLDWSEEGWRRLLDKAAAYQYRGGPAPLWALVPDKVADREGTLARWEAYAPELRGLYGWPLAFAVQDGMTAADVPADAQVVFVGGTTRWKRRHIGHFCARFPRVHVGRINTGRWLWLSAEYGAESCDGTGWFRGDPNQLADLHQFLEAWKAGQRERPKGPLFDEVVA